MIWQAGTSLGSPSPSIASIVNSADPNYILGAFKPACNISITFADAKTRKQVPLKKENGQTILVPLFHSQENIAGKVLLVLISSFS
ncbi:putative vacuolar protein sorting protein 26 related protein [Helianthus anomalus]